ncbi:hypothetical protein BDR05DRAFT_996390 [Suillus weaverae]|nr:hypothetical protein BDR05DRAFT_996390 [Suillus weaverae]
MSSYTAVRFNDLPVTQYNSMDVDESFASQASLDELYLGPDDEIEYDSVSSGPPGMVAATPGLLNEASTTRQQWDILAMHFGHLDMSSQFELQAQLFAEKLKDADDISHYISIFEHARQCFAKMAIMFTDGEAVFLLLQGLLQTPEWIIFKRMTMTSYSNSHSSLLASGSSTTMSTTAIIAVPKMSFTTIAFSLSEEANQIHSE